MQKSDNLRIICTTCLSFEDIYRNNRFCLEKFWPNHPRCDYVTDFLTPDQKCDENVFAYRGNYSDRLLKHLRSIDSEYILLMLDDYYYNKPVNYCKIQDLIKTMSDYNISYFKLYKDKYGKKIDTVHKIKKLQLKQTYEVSMVPSIWRRESLIKILSNNKSPWQTEVAMTLKCRKYCLKCFSCYDNNILSYEDIVRKGKYIRKSMRFLFSNDLYVSNRQIMTRRETIKLQIKSFVASLLPKGTKRFLAKVFRIKTYSSMEDEIS